MPAATELELRSRAVVAFTLLTGARDGAIASMKLKHIDLVACSVHYDAREVKTKFSKTFVTYFFPVGPESRETVARWVTYLRDQKHWGNDDPLFPATQMIVNEAGRYEAAGLKREHWSTAAPVRRIFRDAFSSAGLPYFNPHSLRTTLVRLGEAVCKTPEEFKAWSQNLGHDGVLTTFYSYGGVGSQRQREIIQGLAESRQPVSVDVAAMAKAIARELRSCGPI
jgi:integrase/recombinase XerD